VPMTTFRRDTEAQAYWLLHTQGIDALEDQWPGQSNHLLNHWYERGLCRVTFTDEGRKITTFKKYAREGGPL
jgi:hypothetical protein